MNLQEYADSIVSSADETGARMESFFHGIAGFRTGISGSIKAMPTVAEIASWMPCIPKGHAACQDSVQYVTRLTELLPAGNRAVRNAVIVSSDSGTGRHFLTLQDVTVLDDSSISLRIEPHSRLMSALETCTHRLPAAICLNADSSLTFVAALHLPETLNPFSTAGFFRKRHFDLATCMTQDLNVPADTGIVIEGYVQKSDETRVFHSECITRKRGAAFVPEDVDFGPAIERIWAKFLRLTSLPQLRDLHFPADHPRMAAALICDNPGRSTASIANALWSTGLMEDIDFLLITDRNADIRSKDLISSLADRARERESVITQTVGSRIRLCLDATVSR